MNQFIRKSYIALGALLALTACSENSWNDKLEGFEPPVPGMEVETVTYTMTAADYKTLAGLSDNKAIAEAAGETTALENIGKNATFTSEEQAHKYMPAFLANSSFPYFTLDNGSSVKVTYNVAADMNPEVTAINSGIDTYTVTESNYKTVWGSSTNYISAFAPAHPAAAALPGLLATAYPDATAGTYAMASYNQSAVNPVFGGGSGNSGDDTPWTTSDELGNVSEGMNLEIRGIITGICTQGFIVTDKGGSMFIYVGSSFDMNAYAINDLVTVKGSVMGYNTGWQIKDANIVKAGEGDYELPDPKEYTGEMLTNACARTGNTSPEYVSVTGKVTVSDKGYYNLIVSGADNCQASCYMLPEKFKNMMTDGGNYTVTGWFTSVSSSKYMNIVVTGVAPATANAPRRAMRRAESIAPLSAEVALYKFDGTAWAAASDAIVLQAADYTAMGQSHSNLTGTDPEKFLPIFLKGRLPYAANGDSVIVVYAYYASSATTYRASEFVYTAGEWTLNAGSQTEQYSKSDNKWQYNPSVVINLPADKSAFSVNFYQTCVDWVYETKCVPLGDTSIKSGKFWVTSYGNNEYWSGTSAYQTNVDIRPSAARNQYAAGFEGMTDLEVQEFIMTNLCEGTFPAALHILYPDTEPIPGIDLTYTINFGTYDGARATETAVFEVVGKGEYKFRSCTWFGNVQ